ncbi:hypothetical protein [Alicyclobacillus macrosporangiidus]|uniref:hypothetical protein n=1 Tax=Alicyclobacillus macrosporangiidus TaxID=392015 RepID=UPI000944A2CF|nr:hypothetical protein [Alicyclobacillus macrosporangiidus]
MTIRCYPRSWRARYEDEPHAVLEQHRVTWRTLLDLGIGAVVARFTWERPGLWWFRYVSGVLVLSFLAMVTYGVIQHTMRAAANQPQLEMVGAIAERLGEGAAIQSVAGRPVVHVKTSLDPFVIVYDAHGQVRYSNAQLDGKTPVLSPGVLGYAKAHGRDVLTWEPQPGVRIAAVVEPYGGADGGFVLAGRSLRVTEQDEDALLRGIGVAYLAVSAAFTAGLWSWYRMVKRRRTAGQA